MVGEAIPSSSPSQIFLPVFRVLRSSSTRFLPHRFLPSTLRSRDHGPAERQAHETSTEEASVSALSDLLCSRPAERHPPTLLRQGRVPASEQSRQPPPLAPEARQPRVLHRPHPRRACPAVAQSPPGLLAPPGLSVIPYVTRSLNGTTLSKSIT